jgi:hypothetical protein
MDVLISFTILNGFFFCLYLLVAVSTARERQEYRVRREQKKKREYARLKKAVKSPKCPVGYDCELMGQRTGNGCDNRIFCIELCVQGPEERF